MQSITKPQHATNDTYQKELITLIVGYTKQKMPEYPLKTNTESVRVTHIRRPRTRSKNSLSTT